MYTQVCMYVLCIYVCMCVCMYICMCMYICDRFWENRSKRGKQYFQYPRVKPYVLIFFENFLWQKWIHQLALTYDAQAPCNLLVE